MKKLAILALLVLPAVAFAGGNATLSLVANGTTTWAKSSTPGTLGTVTVTIKLTGYDVADYGISNLSGFLDVSQGGIFATSARSFGSPFTGSDFPGATNLTEAIAGLQSTKNWGVAATSEAGSGLNGYYVAPTDGDLPWTIETFTVKIPITAVGSWTMALSTNSYVARSDANGLADKMSTTVSAPLNFTVTPEPATMLLLAAAVPFLRRRSA